MSDFAVRGGTIVTAAGTIRADLLVRNGTVAHIGEAPGSVSHSIDATNLLVLPGGVDTHVHLMDPGDTTREDFPHGTAAAAARGVTTIVEHTHGHPLRQLGEFAEKRHHLDGRSNVDFGLAGHTWPDMLDHIPELWRGGVTFFKIFTCTTHGVPGLGSADLLAALRAMSEVGASCLIHCEDEAITATAERALRESGRSDNGILVEWRNREAELAATAAAASLIHVTGSHATIAHVSSPAVAAVIADAAKRGADIVAEACPQYLALREDEVLEHGALRKFTPPARARTDGEVDAMWELIRNGTYGHFSTDHAPSTIDQKQAGDIWTAPFGLPGLDTTLPFLVDAALSGRIELTDVARLYSEAPAKRYGLYPRKGHLGIGADADFVLIDPSAQWAVRNDELLSKAGWSPFAGTGFSGRSVATYLRGIEIARDGRSHGGLSGSFIPGPGAASA